MSVVVRHIIIILTNGDNESGGDHKLYHRKQPEMKKMEAPIEKAF